MIPFVRTALHVDVGYTQVGAGERLALKVDVAALLEPGQVASAPAATITDRATGSSTGAGMLGQVTLAGTVMTVPVYGFQAGKQYRLAGTFAPAAGIVREWLWDLDCVA